MIARLVSLEGNAAILLDRPLVLVGRDPRCDARIDSPRVSRVHCYLAPERAGVAVRDLGSTNGIRINGVRLVTGQLRVGDVLSVADYRYFLEDGRDSGPDRTWPATGGAADDRRPGLRIGSCEVTLDRSNPLAGKGDDFVSGLSPCHDT